MFLVRVMVLSVAVLFAAPSQNPSSVEDGIAKIRMDWARDLREKRLNEIVMLYTPDADFISPDVGRVAGREAIRELCKKVMATFTSDLTFHSLKTENSGSLAYDSGEFTETLTKLSDGTKSDDHGSYLMVFKRQPDGNWLIVQQMWAGPPPAH